MNSNTRDKLIQFIDAVETMARLALSNPLWPQMPDEVSKAAKELKEQLNSDETII